MEDLHLLGPSKTTTSRCRMPSDRPRQHLQTCLVLRIRHREETIISLEARRQLHLAQVFRQPQHKINLALHSPLAQPLLNPLRQPVSTSDLALQKSQRASISVPAQQQINLISSILVRHLRNHNLRRRLRRSSTQEPRTQIQNLRTLHFLLARHRNQHQALV